MHATPPSRLCILPSVSSAGSPGLIVYRVEFPVIASKECRVSGSTSGRAALNSTFYHLNQMLHIFSRDESWLVRGEIPQIKTIIRNTVLDKNNYQEYSFG